MPERETLREALEDIRRKLRAGAYQNEEQVRLALVARVLQALGWDIWNPGEVNSEFPVRSLTQGTKRSDLALLDDSSRLVFIEVKRRDKILDEYVEQLNQYNQDFRAPFCILTNGQKWRFYLVYSKRSFENSKFLELDLTEEGLDEIELSLEAYLSKGEVVSGRAQQGAEQELQKSEKEKKLEGLVSDAKKDADNSGTRSVVEVLRELASKSEITATLEECKNAYDNWRKRGETPPPPPPPQQREQSQQRKSGEGGEKKRQQLDGTEFKIDISHDKVAHMRIENGRYEVLIGSWAKSELSNSISSANRNLRNELLSNGILIKEGNFLRFAKSYLFKSVSSAAAQVCGSEQNGWNKWIDYSGRTLGQITGRNPNTRY